MRSSVTQALSPKFRFGPLLARAGAVLGIGAGLGVVSGAAEKSKSMFIWPTVRDELRTERGLTPEEEERGQKLFGIMREFAPSVAKNKILAKSFVSQGLTLPDEGVWTLLGNLTKTQKEISEAQPSLAKPIGLAASAATAAKGLTGAGVS